MANDWNNRVRRYAAPLEAQALRDRPVLLKLLEPVDESQAGRWTDALLAEYGTLSAALNGRKRRTLAAVGGREQIYRMLRAIRACHLNLLYRPIEDHRRPMNGAALATYLEHLVGNDRTESVQVIFLDGSHRLIGCEEMTRGNIDACSLDPGEIVLRAVDLGARALVIAHNHPSGDATPSQADCAFTRNLASACKVFRISLVDHLIITATGFSSFRSQGLI